VVTPSPKNVQKVQIIIKERYLEKALISQRFAYDSEIFKKSLKKTGVSFLEYKLFASIICFPLLGFFIKAGKDFIYLRKFLISFNSTH
jgi:hypothetical protein